jgi:hypothetical protein
VFSFFLRKVFSKNVDHKLEPILTLCSHSHLNPSEEKSALPKNIPGSLPLKLGIIYRRNQSSRSVKRIDRENQSTAPESKLTGKEDRRSYYHTERQRFLEPETTNIRVIVGTCSLAQVDPTGGGGCNSANRVSTHDGKSSVHLASQGHCAGVFISIRVPSALC